MQLLAILLSLAGAQPGQRAACLDVRHGQDVPVSLAGRLVRRIYPGPPDYGASPNDRRETVYLLVLDRPICVDDGGEYGNPAEPFRRVQLYSGSGALEPRLRAATGRRIRIGGAGFAAHTGHHRTPLVVDVRTLRVEGR